VTHDQVEAMTMGHRVAVLKDARLQQVDTPRNLYERPANVFGQPGPAGTPGALALTVALVEELGADAYVYGELAGDTPDDKPWVVRCDGRAVPRIGDSVGVVVRASDAHVFNRQTGLRLN
jgi:multiple sugar transport system ATP-binding protein